MVRGTIPPYRGKGEIVVERQDQVAVGGSEAGDLSGRLLPSEGGMNKKQWIALAVGLFFLTLLLLSPPQWKARHVHSIHVVRIEPQRVFLAPPRSESYYRREIDYLGIAFCALGIAVIAGAAVSVLKDRPDATSSLRLRAAVLVAFGAGVGLFLDRNGLLSQRLGTAPPAHVVIVDSSPFLVETRNELAQRVLDDKNYKKAIDIGQVTMDIIKEENASQDHPIVVSARKIIDDARTRFGAIESTAAEAEDAYRGNDLATAALKVQELVELDPQHPVARELSVKLDPQLKAQAGDAHRAMVEAKDRADKIRASVTAEFQAEGRPDLGRAEEAAAEAEASLNKDAFGPAMRKFAEARDAYERGRRAIETKLADAARRDPALRALLKVPAEEARRTMTQVRGVAELAGAATNFAAREEFSSAAAFARDAEAAMGRSDYLGAKKDLDAARIGFDRARRIAVGAAQPVVPVPSVSPSPRLLRY
jgi:hypothetical protein